MAKHSPDGTAATAPLLQSGIIGGSSPSPGTKTMTDWFKQISDWRDESDWESWPPPKIYQSFCGYLVVNDIEVFYDGHEREWGYDIYGNYCPERIFETKLHLTYKGDTQTLVCIEVSFKNMIERSKILVQLYMKRKDEAT